MNNLEVLFFALPSVVMFGLTMYLKSVNEGRPKERAVTLGWTYGILALGFFVLVYVLKFMAIRP